MSRTLQAEQLATALRGKLLAVYQDHKGRGHATVDVVVPVDVRGDGTVDVVAKTLMPRSPDRAIPITRRTSLLYGGSGRRRAGVWRGIARAAGTAGSWPPSTPTWSRRADRAG